MRDKNPRKTPFTAIFSGDKQPSTGDPAKREVAWWRRGWDQDTRYRKKANPINGHAMEERNWHALTSVLTNDHGGRTQFLGGHDTNNKFGGMRRIGWREMAAMGDTRPNGELTPTGDSKVGIEDGKPPIIQIENFDGKIKVEKDESGKDGRKRAAKIGWQETADVVDQTLGNAAYRYLFQWANAGFPTLSMGTILEGRGLDHGTRYEVVANDPPRLRLVGGSWWRPVGTMYEWSGRSFHPMPSNPQGPVDLRRIAANYASSVDWGEMNRRMRERRKDRQVEYVPGGLAEGKPDSRYDPRQIQMGKEVEKEHSPDPRVTKEISKDHLEEIPDYYDRLKRMEDRAKEEGATREASAGAKVGDEVIVIADDGWIVGKGSVTYVGDRTEVIFDTGGGGMFPNRFVRNLDGIDPTLPRFPKGVLNGMADLRFSSYDAEWLGWQRPLSSGKPSIALYNVVRPDHPLYRSTVSLQTLEREGLSHEPPPPEKD